jgi:hypothetical protein
MFTKRTKSMQRHEVRKQKHSPEVTSQVLQATARNHALPSTKNMGTIAASAFDTPPFQTPMDGGVASERVPKTKHRIDVLCR